MLTFKRWTRILGYAAALLLFLILALIFFDMVARQTTTEKQIVKVENKAEANAVDIWRISLNGEKKYRLKAKSMDKKKNGVVILHDAQLWYFEKSKPVIYLRADKAVIYKNNNVYATGNVLLKRKDLRIYAKSVYWNDRTKQAKSNKSFRGHTNKSTFFGKEFLYYQVPDKLVVRGADIWLK